MPNDKRPRFVVAPQTHAFGLFRMFQITGEQTRPVLTVVLLSFAARAGGAPASNQRAVGREEGGATIFPEGYIPRRKSARV
jgi:hypothetical protein